MDQDISISTPGSLEFSHEPAGIGPRFVASVIDAILQAVVMIGVLTAAGSSTIWTGAITILLAFVVLWGYHIFFGMIWNGQTHGRNQNSRGWRLSHRVSGFFGKESPTWYIRRIAFYLFIQGD
jgi:hypothetical protein